MPHQKYDGEQIESALCVQCAAVCVIFQGLCQNAGEAVSFGTMSQKLRRGGLEDENTCQGGGHDGQPGSIAEEDQRSASTRMPLSSFSFLSTQSFAGSGDREVVVFIFTAPFVGEGLNEVFF